MPPIDLSHALDTWRDALRWDRDEVLAEQVALLRRSFPATLGTSLFTAVGTTWIMSLVLPQTPMLWWLASHIATVALVYLILRPLPRVGVAARRDGWRMMACMAAMGLTWGSLGWVVWRYGRGTEGVIYATGILGTVSSGALGLGATVLRGFVIYLAVVVGSLIVPLAIDGGPIALPACAMLSMYFALTSVHARNLAQATLRSIETKFDNERLVVQLLAQTQRA